MSKHHDIALSTTPWDLHDLAKALQPGSQIRLDISAHDRIQQCHAYLRRKLETSDAAIYGINTGFGALRNTSVPADQLQQLQINLVRSHACGAGAEVPAHVVRTMLLLKARSLSYGYSGVQVATVQRLLDFFNHNVLPVVYTQGSLGASGDLAPLAHLCLPLIGEGEVDWNGKRMLASEVLQIQGWEPIDLHPKEGLALLNGTQFMLAYAVTSLIEAEQLSAQADQIAALSIDAFDGRSNPFHHLLHAIRPHAGQVATAAAILRHLEGSEIAARPKTDVQDPYSFRCVPQVHGASKDALAYCQQVFVTEMNSTTDNPNIFPEEDLILSGGNFHGQPLALALDFLAIALAELGSISERRVFQLLAGIRGLPPFLVANAGLNSGLMIAQYTAASIVSKNKLLCVPASVDSIPSSNGQEDHVSMGSIAAVKALEVCTYLRTLLSIELLTASQALWFRLPAKTSPGLEALVDAYRKVVPPVESDRVLQKDIAAGVEFLAKRS